MSDWKARAIERRDFRQVKTDESPKYRKKRSKRKPWKLVLISESFPGAKLSQSYGSERSLNQALDEARRKNRDENFVLKYKKFQVFHEGKLKREGVFK